MPDIKSFYKTINIFIKFAPTVHIGDLVSKEKVTLFTSKIIYVEKCLCLFSVKISSCGFTS